METRTGAVAVVVLLDPISACVFYRFNFLVFEEAVSTASIKAKWKWGKTGSLVLINVFFFFKPWRGSVKAQFWCRTQKQDSKKVKSFNR